MCVREHTKVIGEIKKMWSHLVNPDVCIKEMIIDETKKQTNRLVVVGWEGSGIRNGRFCVLN